MAGNKRLAGYVTVAGVTYGPSDDVPADIAARITNPKAWASDSDDEDDYDEDVQPGTRSGARLAGHVTVDGVTYGPYDSVPDEVAARIRNPKAWEGGELPELAAEPEQVEGDAKPKDTDDGGEPAKVDEDAAGDAGDEHDDEHDSESAGAKPARRSARGRAK